MRSQPYIHRLGRVGSHGVCSGGGAGGFMNDRIATSSRIADHQLGMYVCRYVCMQVCRCCQQQKQYVRLLVIAAAMVVIVVVEYIHTYRRIGWSSFYQSTARHVLLVQPIYIHHSSLIVMHSFIYPPSHNSTNIHFRTVSGQRIPPSPDLPQAIIDPSPSTPNPA